MMKNISAIVIFVVSACLASQALAQISSRRGGAAGLPNPGSSRGNGEQSEPLAPATKLPPDPEGVAVELRLQGKCDEAIPILRRLVRRGSGFELAEFDLGLCLFDIADTESDAQRATRARNEAADWMIKAANAGLPNAQLRLVSLYLDGMGVGSDPAEAGKWSLLYHSNGSRLVLGLKDIPLDVRTRLDATLSEKTWSDAQSRADSWVPASQSGDGGN